MLMQRRNITDNVIEFLVEASKSSLYFLFIAFFKINKFLNQEM